MAVKTGCSKSMALTCLQHLVTALLLLIAWQGHHLARQLSKPMCLLIKPPKLSL